MKNLIKTTISIIVILSLAFSASGCSLLRLVGTTGTNADTDISASYDSAMYPTAEQGISFRTISDGDYVCIAGLPKKEEVTIPAYYRGMPVKYFGYHSPGFFSSGRDNYVDFDGIKKLNFSCFVENRYVKNYDSVDVITYTDYPYLWLPHGGSQTDKTWLGTGTTNSAVIHLLRSDKERDYTDFEYKYIYLGVNVAVIESGVFDGLTDVTIGTAYEYKPNGWADGWNGSCPVRWGIELSDL